jgi:NAD(P)-dependent dehydrogenase (short-subunit alcohol dehydrogenase family)
MSTPVVSIAGALTGIGRVAAAMFAPEGARVVASGRRDKQGQELAAPSRSGYYGYRHGHTLHQHR